MQLELSSEERAVLERILERVVSDLRVEVRRTTTPEFHDEMRADRERLEQLLARVRTLA